jgi:hypothetical protein
MAGYQKEDGANQTVSFVTHSSYVDYYKQITMYRVTNKSLAQPTYRYRTTESIVLLETHTILTEPLGEHAPSYVTVKDWVAKFQRVDFSTYFFPSLAKDLSAPR